MHNFTKDDAGATSLTFSLMLVGVLFAIGVAIDTGRAFSYKQDLQSSLDAATLFAALNVKENDFQDDAKLLFRANLDPDRLATAKSDFKRDTGIVRGNATGSVDLAFGGIIGRNSLPVSVVSTVSVEDDASSCIIALDTDQRGVNLNGGTILIAPECGIEVHSVSNPAMSINSGLKVDVPEICVKGSRINDNSNGQVPNIKLNCEVNPDPYLGVFDVPDSSICDFNSRNFNDSEITLEPGVYCGNFNFNGSPNVTFTGGEQPYILRNSRWIINGGNWEGEEVSFYFADQNSEILFNSGVRAELTPPRSGPYEGVFMTEAPGLNDGRITFNDSEGFDVEGIVYLPSREMNMNGGATLRARELQFVARSFSFNGAQISLETPSQVVTVETFPFLIGNEPEEPDSE